MNDTSEAPDSKKDPEILFENDSVKVSVITEHVQGTGQEAACLAYFTERELLERYSRLDAEGKRAVRAVTAIELLQATKSSTCFL